MIALRKDKNQIIDVGTEDDVQETSDPETRDNLQFITEFVFEKLKVGAEREVIFKGNKLSSDNISGKR